MKITKIAFIFLIYLFLNGCIQSTALLGPGITVVTSGNVLQAGFQYGANTAIKNETKSFKGIKPYDFICFPFLEGSAS